ncbi:UNVERIFIED_CONTAM: ABC transporter F family member 4 [Sesamum calycinum]|uniref:ABC transporter F family member 4 n=1 Tax=Sesamum calycinum TaxID=2727403 RepID=A0AAW2JA44_9LAMI
MVLILVCDSEFSVSDLVCEGDSVWVRWARFAELELESSNSSDRARYMSLCIGLFKGVKAAVIMGKKKSDEGSTKAKQGGKEKLSVSALLASMDAKPDKPKKAASSKPKPKVAQKVSSYTDGIDLPSSDEEDDVLDSEEEQKQNDIPKKQGRQNRSAATLDITVSDKELKKREKKDFFATQAAELAKQEALKDDRDAFTVVIGSRASVLDGGDDADANVKDITVDNFSVSARGKELLKNASVKISHGKRYGLVGPNGMGKSTLLKLLAWRKIPVPKNIDVLLVEQEVVGDDRSAIEAVVSANEELIKLRQEVAVLQDSTAVSTGDNEDDDEGDDVGEKLSDLYEKLQLMGSDAAEAQASKILAGLGFTKDMQGRPTKSFSGGWRMRISLARALFVQPTLLLLDEPTNHLDLRAVLWLEEYLCRWKKTLVVVSHDRDFLNTVCNEIIHLHDMKLHFYRGNFDDFESGYEQRRKEMNKKFEIYDKQVKAAKRSGSRAQQEKVKDRAKFAAAKEAAKNKGKGKVDEDDPLPEAPQKWRDYTVEFHFPEPTELTPPLLQLIEVSFSYPGRNDFRLSNVDVGIDMGTRVAIVGPNGAGKSTLLNLLAGDIVPTEGEVRKSQKLRIGRYSQHFVDLLTMDETPVQYLLRLHPDQEGLSKQEAVRAKLGKFGLPSHNHLTPITKLSGGQKARVVFTSISMSKPHILLLDEPTNHLDMQSIDALADALDEFTGGVVLVSHDSRLISRVCEDEEKSEIWVVENGTVEAFPGSFEEYKEELIKEIRAEVDD